jgi:hypothetical protein
LSYIAADTVAQRQRRLVVRRGASTTPHFLAPAGVPVIWIDAEQHSGQRMLKSILERLGFRIEAGTCYEDGVAISARRTAVNPQAEAA